MSFIEDQHLILPQFRISLCLGQQDAVGHELDPGLTRSLILETHLVSHVSAERHPEFFRHAFRHARRRDPPRLGAADPPALRTHRLRHHFRELRGFSGARIAHDHDDLMRPQCGKNLLPVLDHRQFLGIIPCFGKCRHANLNNFRKTRDNPPKNQDPTVDIPDSL